MTVPVYLTPCKGEDLRQCGTCRRLDAHEQYPRAVPMRPMVNDRGYCKDYEPVRPGQEV